MIFKYLGKINILYKKNAARSKWIKFLGGPLCSHNSLQFGLGKGSDILSGSHTWCKGAHSSRQNVPSGGKLFQGCQMISKAGGWRDITPERAVTLTRERTVLRTKSSSSLKKGQRNMATWLWKMISSQRKKIQYNWIVDVFFKCNEYFSFPAYEFKIKILLPKKV